MRHSGLQAGTHEALNLANKHANELGHRFIPAELRCQAASTSNRDPVLLNSKQGPAARHHPLRKIPEVIGDKGKESLFRSYTILE